jgi:hypothetical protein
LFRFFIFILSFFFCFLEAAYHPLYEKYEKDFLTQNPELRAKYFALKKEEANLLKAFPIGSLNASSIVGQTGLAFSFEQKVPFPGKLVSYALTNTLILEDNKYAYALAEAEALSSFKESYLELLVRHHHQELMLEKVNDLKQLENGLITSGTFELKELTPVRIEKMLTEDELRRESIFWKNALAQFNAQLSKPVDEEEIHVALSQTTFVSYRANFSNSTGAISSNLVISQKWLRQLPAYLVKKNELAISKAMGLDEVNDLFPELSVKTLFDQRLGGFYPASQPFEISFNLDFSWLLFPKVAAFSSVHFEKTMREYELASLEKHLAADLFSLINQYLNDKQTLSLLVKQIRPASLQLSRELRQNAMTGKSGLRDWIEAKRQSYEIENRILETRIEMEKTLSALQNKIGSGQDAQILFNQILLPDEANGKSL